MSVLNTAQNPLGSSTQSKLAEKTTAGSVNPKTSGTITADRLTQMVKKSYDEIKNKIAKDYKDKGDLQYRMALKNSKQTLSKITEDSYGKAVLDRIQSERSQKGKTGPLNEKEIQSALKSVGSEMRKGFEQSLIQGIRQNMNEGGRGYSAAKKTTSLSFMA